MKRNIKRLSAMLLSAVLSVSAFGGCSSSTIDVNGSSGAANGTEAENPGSSGASQGSGSLDDIIPKDTVTLTVFSERANYSGEQIGWFAQIMKEKFNVVLNIVPNGSGVFETRMESGNLGDIVVFGRESDFIKAKDAGYLFDWEEDDILSTYGSYIEQNAKAVLEKNRSMSDDGKIYGMGYTFATSSKDKQSFFYTWDIRWDLYEELGHPEVKNLDDMLELFKDMKEICPTDEAGNPTYAVSLWPDWDGDMVMYVKSTATAYYGYDEFGVGLYDPETGKFYGALDEGSPYLEMLQFYNKLYQNDLLDPDSMTATYDTMIEKVKKSGTFYSIFNYAGSLAYNTNDHMDQNKIMRSLTPEEASPIVYGLNVYGGNNYFAIGAKTEYPELCMAILNYLSTPEGRMTSDYGPKGITWDYDEEGYAYLTELGQKMVSDNTVSFPEGSAYSGTKKDGECQINCLTWASDSINLDSKVGETYNWQSWRSTMGEPKNAADKDWREFNGGVTTVNEYMEKGKYTVAPGSTYVMSEQTDELKTTWAQVTKCIREYSWKAIYAKDDAEFEKCVSGMKGLAKQYGYQKCWDWTNEEAAKRKAAEDEAQALSE